MTRPEQTFLEPMGAVRGGRMGRKAMGTAATTRPQVYTVHGPPGVSAEALLRACAIRLSEQDILLIAEHDDATDAWLENGLGESG